MKFVTPTIAVSFQAKRYTLQITIFALHRQYTNGIISRP